MQPETRLRSGLLPWILLSGCLHAGLAFALWSASLRDAPEMRPSHPIRLTLLRDAPGTGEPAAAPRAPAPERPAPAPKQPAARAKPAPAPAAPGGAAESAASQGATATPGEAGTTTTLAAVAAGPPGAGGTLGGDPLAAYVRQVRESIARHKRYPALARRRGIEGRVVLRLAIAQDGSLVASEAVDSPSLVLARSALSAVAAASPFPPPPAGALRIEVPIRFALQE